MMEITIQRPTMSRLERVKSGKGKSGFTRAQEVKVPKVIANPNPTRLLLNINFKWKKFSSFETLLQQLVA
jgi:hypothetical protein